MEDRSRDDMTGVYEKGTYQGYYVKIPPGIVRAIAKRNLTYCPFPFPEEKGRVLDVGCGTGAFLEIMGARGWETHGVELSERSAVLAKKKAGVHQVTQGLFEDFPEGGDPFDLVTMWMVLEHLPDPRMALIKASNLLRPGGLLVFSVPNGQSLLHVLASMIHALSSGRELRPLRRLINSEHINAFSERSLKGCLKRFGFRHVKTIQDERYITKFALNRLPLPGRALLFSIAKAGRILGRQEQLAMVFLKTGDPGL
jgi:2-polyprenyl-3-methyl-5-hydroxy-6-metoxy-1,4-benzoquinol methylase